MQSVKMNCLCCMQEVTLLYDGMFVTCPECGFVQQVDQDNIEKFERDSSIKVGLIKGRYGLPVEKYLIEQENVPSNEVHRMAYSAMQDLIKKYDGDVDLYISNGPMMAVLGAFAGWINSHFGIEDSTKTNPTLESRILNILEYNNDTCEYECKISLKSDGLPHRQLYGDHSYELLWHNHCILS